MAVVRAIPAVGRGRRRRRRATASVRAAAGVVATGASVRRTSSWRASAVAASWSPAAPTASAMVVVPVGVVRRRPYPVARASAQGGGRR